MMQEIHDRITSIGYDQCKVYIHSIDSQSSANGGIIIIVIGEMSNANGPWRKFTQTFFLAEQPNGYFVLNDIFRYLKEDVEEEIGNALEVSFQPRRLQCRGKLTNMTSSDERRWRSYPHRNTFWLHRSPSE